MIRQYIFLYILYVLGLMWGLSFKKLPTLFVFFSGFLWGAMIWALASFLGLIVFRFFIPVNIFLISIFISAAFFVFRLAELKKEWPRLIKWFIGSSFLFLILSYLFHRFNYTYIGPDSVVFIANGRQIFLKGLTEFTKNELVLRGIFLPLIQSASVMTKFQYLSSFAPMLNLSFTLSFGYLCWYSIRQIGNGVIRFLAVAFTILSLGSIPIVLEHLFYVHVNLPSAAYFSIAVISLWLALKEKNEDWFILGIVALTGFNLLRIEAPIFSIAVLMLVIHKEEIGYKFRLISLLPFSLFFIVYYSFLTLLLAGGDTYILSPAKSIITVAAYCLFLTYFLLLKTRLVPGLLIKWLPSLLVGILLSAVIFLLFSNPAAMKSAITMWFGNLLRDGFWGNTWYILIPILIALSLLKKSKNEYLFITWIILFVLILILVNFQLYPYHFKNSGDSANRIMLHIVPVIFYYILIKWGDFVGAATLNKMEAVKYCQVCNANTKHVEKYIKWGYSIQSCANCGLGSTQIEDVGAVQEIYDASYFEGGQRDGYHNYLGSEPILRREFNKIISQILPYKANGRLLEIGCAYGYFLLEALPHFEAVGVEISEHAVNYCKSKDLDVHLGQLNEETAETFGTFDVIIMLDVIEHLDEPLKTLSLANSMLNPNGIVVISTGDWASIPAKMLGKNWRLMTPPQHLFYFPRQALHILLEAAGFKIIKSEYPWKFVPLSLIFYQIISRVGGRFVRNMANIPESLGSLGLPVNLFDAVRVIAKKK